MHFLNIKIYLQKRIRCPESTSKSKSRIFDEINRTDLGIKRTCWAIADDLSILFVHDQLFPCLMVIATPQPTPLMNRPAKIQLYDQSPFWKQNTLTVHQFYVICSGFLHLCIVKSLHNWQVTSILVTDVGEQMCWWQVLDVGNRFNTLRSSPS